jgi:hypothetical protein
MAAGLGFKTFATGDVLSAGDTNGYLMQGVLVFASATARDAAITSPQEGQFAYLKDTDATVYYSGSAWTAVGGASGGMTLISTTSLTGSSVSVAVPSGYKDIAYVVRNPYAAAGGAYFTQTLNSDTGTNYNMMYYKGTAPTTAGSEMATEALIYSPYINGSSNSNSFLAVTIFDYLNTSSNKVLQGNFTWKNNSVVRVVGGYTASYFPTTPAAITSIQFACQTSNFSGGSVLLYGVN